MPGDLEKVGSGDGMAAQEPAAPGSGYVHECPTPVQREAAMARCETCGNDYDKAFQVSMNGATHTFDSFECAIQAMAPSCAHCGCKIVGHGVEAAGNIFCCAHCAQHQGGIRDRAA